MAFNRLLRIEQGQLYSALNQGSVVAGPVDLAVKSSTGVCGVCVDFSGNIFLTDSVKHIILKIDRSGTTGAINVSTYAGVAAASGDNSDNTVKAYEARFNAPEGICCDRSGNLYVADTGNNQIRKIDPNRNVSLLAGQPNASSGYTNGVALSAKFLGPVDVAVDNSGTVFVADTGNHAVRAIRGGRVSTIAGGNGSGDAIDPYAAATSKLKSPAGVAVNLSGQIFIADSGNYRIKVVQNDGRVFFYSGAGAAGGATQGTTVGIHSVCKFLNPRFMTCDRTGNLWLVDWSSSTSTRLMRIDTNGTSAVVVDFATAEDPFVTSVAVDQAGVLYLTESISQASPSVRSSSSSSSTKASGSSSSSSTAVSVSSSSSTKVSVSSSSSSTKVSVSSSNSTSSTALSVSSSSP